MTRANPDDPSDSPLEPDSGESDEGERTVRQRVRDVLGGVSQPAKVRTVAEMADCSVEGARDALREYEDLGLVVRTNDNPESYRKNPAYFQFLRGHRLAQDHSTEELRDRLAEKYAEHREYADYFDAASHDAVDGEAVIEEQGEDAFEALREWEAVVSEADDLREAYRQQTEVFPPRLEALATEMPPSISLDDLGVSPGDVRIDSAGTVPMSAMAAFVQADPTQLAALLEAIDSQSGARNGRIRGLLENAASDSTK